MQEHCINPVRNNDVRWHTLSVFPLGLSNLGPWAVLSCPRARVRRALPTPYSQQAAIPRPTTHAQCSHPLQLVPLVPQYYGCARAFHAQEPLSQSVCTPAEPALLHTLSEPIACVRSLVRRLRGLGILNTIHLNPTISPTVWAIRAFAVRPSGPDCAPYFASIALISASAPASPLRNRSNNPTNLASRSARSRAFSGPSFSSSRLSFASLVRH